MAWLPHCFWCERRRIGWWYNARVELHWWRDARQKGLQKWSFKQMCCSRSMVGIKTETFEKTWMEPIGAARQFHIERTTRSKPTVHMTTFDLLPWSGSVGPRRVGQANGKCPQAEDFNYWVAVERLHQELWRAQLPGKRLWHQWLFT